MTAVYGVAAYLAVLVAALIWERWGFMHAPRKFVIAAGPQSRWRTRPLLIRTRADKELVESVARAVEEAGLVPPKLLLFHGQPTMDLIFFDPEKPDMTASQLSDLLRGFPMRIESIRGKRLPLRYH